MEPKGSTQDDIHIVDLYFHIQGKEIAVDHGYALYGAISHVLEPDPQSQDNWLHGAEKIGLLMIRGHYSGQGKLLLNERARFGLRLPVTLIPKALRLAGKRLQINGDALRIGVSNTSALVPASTLYAHTVTTRNGEDETRFDAEIRHQLELLEIKGRATRGQRRIITIKGKKVVGYSLLVSELDAEESIRLQEHGLGGRRKMGCGVFITRCDSEPD